MRSRYVCTFLVASTLAFSGSVLASGHPAPRSVELTGVAQFVVWTARTGEMISPPSMNFCPIVEARLTRGAGFFAKLHTKEDCGAGGFLREMKWDVVMARDGKLAMKLPKFATYLYPDGSSQSVDVLAELQEHTGCPLHGTIPVFYGHFDGTLFHANGELQGVCTGGTLWGPFLGVSEALGPLHFDYLISLEVDK
jgi:hypothetical protein